MRLFALIFTKRYEISLNHRDYSDTQLWGSRWTKRMKEVDTFRVINIFMSDNNMYKSIWLEL